MLLDFHDALLDRRDEFVDLVQYRRRQGSAQCDRGGAARRPDRPLLRAGPPSATCATERGTGLLPLLTRIDRRYKPKGLVGVIAPWNYPLTMAISDGLAALVAGNAVLLKPDHQTPLVALAAVRAAARVRPARRSVAGGQRRRATRRAGS